MAVLAFAKEHGIPVIPFKQSGTEGKYVGETPKNMEAHFMRAAQFPRAIVLIDELGKFFLNVTSN